MRIRLFESHLEEYYQKVNIDVSEFNKQIRESGEWFSKKEYKKILNLIDDCLGLEDSRGIISAYCHSEIINIDIQFVSLGFRLIKMDDDWYYVNFQSREGEIDVYYKCDQYDGLVQLLRNCDEMKEIKRLILKNKIDNQYD